MKTKKTAFIEKASYCDYNRLWKCIHKKQMGKKCTRICKYYSNPREVDTIKN